jgi:hypothetical protein
MGETDAHAMRGQIAVLDEVAAKYRSQKNTNDVSIIAMEGIKDITKAGMTAGTVGAAATGLSVPMTLAAKQRKAMTVKK